MSSVYFPSTVGLEVEWDYPEALAMRYRLVQIERDLENTQVLTERLKDYLQDAMESRFDREVDPDGVPWTPLVQPDNPYEHQILQLSTTMREAALSDDAWTATPTGVFFDTGVLPDYWAYHEQPEGAGSQRISQRRFIGASVDSAAQAQLIGEEWIVGITLGGRVQRQSRSPLGQFTRIF